jgi:MoaD family protein
MNEKLNIKVKVLAGYRQIIKGKEVEILVKGETVREAVDSLIMAHPGLGPLIKDEKGIKPYVSILLNGKVINKGGMVVSSIKDGDILTVFPSVPSG